MNAQDANFYPGAVPRRNGDVLISSNFPSGQNTGQFGAGSAINSHGRGSTSNSVNVPGPLQSYDNNTIAQKQNQLKNQINWQGQQAKYAKTGAPTAQPQHSSSLDPRQIDPTGKSAGTALMKANTGRYLPRQTAGGGAAPQQKPQSRTMRNNMPRAAPAGKERRLVNQPLQNNYVSNGGPPYDNFADLGAELAGQYATTDPSQLRGMPEHLRAAPAGFDAALQASSDIQNFPLASYGANMGPTPSSSQEGIANEAYKYPPHQQKILLGMQQSNSSSSLPRGSAFNRQNEDHSDLDYSLTHQSSNPRLDLPRQILHQDPEQPSQINYQLQKQLLAQYYQLKFKKEQQETAKLSSQEDIQRFMEYAQLFGGQGQSIPSQSYAAQSSISKKPLVQLPVRQLNIQQQQRSSDLGNSGAIAKSDDGGNSSSKSDKDLEEMISAMKQDVQECKKRLLQEQKSIRSDRGSSAKKGAALPASSHRMKSAESKSSDKLQRDNSYKRPKKDQTSSTSINRAPARDRHNQHSKSSKNSKGMNGSGNKLERVSHQLLPENIFGQAGEPNEQPGNSIDLRNKKQQSPNGKHAHKNLNSLTQFSEQTFNETKTKQGEMKAVSEKQQIAEDEEAQIIKARKEARKMDKKYKEREELKINTADAPRRNEGNLAKELVNPAELEEFKNLNIAGGLSESDDENQQRIFQFSPLSSKKQHGDDDSDNEEGSQGACENYVDQHEDLLDGEIKSESLGPQSAPYSRLQYQGNITNQEEDSIQNQSVSYGEERNLRSGGQILSQAESTGRFLNPVQKRPNGPTDAPSSAGDTITSQRHLQDQISQAQSHQGSLGTPHQVSKQQNMVKAQSLRQQAVATSSQRLVEAHHDQASDSQIINEQITQRLVENQMSTTDRFAALNGTTLTIDQRDQTIISLPSIANRQCQTDQRAALRHKEIQTEKINEERQSIRNLSPFETYDLLFIRDLVNNLNFDNEVLHDNADDLKAAFMFLHNEHKRLQFQYQKEKRNEKLLSLYRERVDQLTAERDTAVQTGMKLRAKVEYMNDVMQMAVEESALQQREDEQLIEQLSLENDELRKVLQIHRKINKQSDSKSRNSSSSEDDNIEQNIDQHLVSLEQEQQRTQNEYLSQLREEQDLQFSREIDEHKEIIQRIYDDKIAERTDEIEQELRSSITKELTEANVQSREEVRNDLKEEITHEVTQEVTQELTRAITDKLTQEISERLNEELRQQIEQELREKYEKVYQDAYDVGSPRSDGREQGQRLLQIKSNAKGDRISQQEENRMKMESLKVEHQKSLEGENDQTSQDLEGLLQYDVIQQNQGRNSKSSSGSSAFREQLEEDKYQDTEKLMISQSATVDENAQTSKMLQSEKTKFKQELLNKPNSLSSTMPPQRQPLQMDDMRRSKEQASSKSGSGTSGQSQSDEWNSGDDELRNQYDFEQIFDDQALSKEEEELFNQLKAREEQQSEGRMFDLTHNKERSDREEEKREMEDDGDLDETLKYNHHLGQETSGLNSFDLANQMPSAFRLRSSDRNTDLKLIPKQNKNERYYQNHLNDGDDVEEQKEEQIHTANNQDEDFQRDPNDDPGANWRPHQQIESSHAQQDDIQEPVGFSSAEHMVESDTQDEEQISNRPSRNQFQGFQGQAVRGHNLVYQGQALVMNNDQMGPTEGGQGQSRGGQRHNMPVSIAPGQDIAGDQSNVNSHQQMQDGALTTQNNSSALNVRGQGFQGQVQGQGLYDFSLARVSPGIEQETRPQQIQEEHKSEIHHNSPALGQSPHASSSSGDSIGSFNNEEPITQSQTSQPKINSDHIDEAYEYDDFFSGLQNEMMHQSANTGVQREGHSQISPSASQDLFGDQLSTDDGILNSTKGLRSMLDVMKDSPIKQKEKALQIQDLLENDEESADNAINHDAFGLNDERNPDNEDVYDYFLEAHKEENMHANAGYHIIDQEDLEASGAKQKQDGEQIDDDDLDQIQDEELKQYRYNNMLEDLKDKIAEEETEHH